jgi:hypothetical protein
MPSVEGDGGKKASKNMDKMANKESIKCAIEASLRYKVDMYE